MKTSKHTARIYPMLLTLGLLVFSLVVAPHCCHAQQSELKQQKQERKKPAKVWTNDDFPSGRAAPQRQAEAKKPPSPPPATPSPGKEDSAFGKLTPEGRKELIGVYEEDIMGSEQSLAELRERLAREADYAVRERLSQEITRLEQVLNKTKEELEVLRKPSPPKPKEDERSKEPK